RSASCRVSSATSPTWTLLSNAILNAEHRSAAHDSNFAIASLRTASALNARKACSSNGGTTTCKMTRDAPPVSASAAAYRTALAAPSEKSTGTRNRIRFITASFGWLQGLKLSHATCHLYD